MNLVTYDDEVRHICGDTNDKGCCNSTAVNLVWCVFVKVVTDMQASDSVGGQNKTHNPSKS